MREQFTEKPMGDALRTEYEQGYTDGYSALGDAMAKASARIGHKPSILRIAEANAEDDHNG